MSVAIHQGDNLNILPTLEKNSVQCVVTSPPYFGLRDYNLPPSQWPTIDYAPMAGLPSVTVPEQATCLGLESDPFVYVAHLVHVFRLVWNVLKDDGTVWLNLGDSYSAGAMVPHSGQRKDRDQSGMSGIVRKPPAGLKPKDLLGIPWRVAYALQADGWYLRSDIVWQKLNPMPESVTDRPTKAHEYVFLLSKSERYFYDKEAIAEPIQESSKARIAQATFHQQTGGPKDYGTTGVNPNRSMRRTLENFAENTTGTRNARTVWTIPTKALAEAHYAPMPEALVEKCIRAGSRAGDTVLDPYFGTGTVGRVAERVQRACIGIELSDSYIDIIERRTSGVQLEAFV